MEIKTLNGREIFHSGTGYREKDVGKDTNNFIDEVEGVGGICTL